MGILCFALIFGYKFITTQHTYCLGKCTSGRVFYGENGTVHIDRDHLESDSEEIVKTLLGEEDVYLPRSPGHHRNWLDCIKSRKAPVADVEKGARTVSMIHLGNLAY